MIEASFTTADLPARERFEGWHELACRVLIPTHVRCDDEADFEASVLLRGSDTVQLSSGKVRSFHAERTQKLVRQSDPERYVLDAVRTGSAGISQGDQETTLKAGDLVLTDSSLPFRARHRTGTHETLAVPKALLPFPAAEMAPLMARGLPGDTGIGAVLSHCLHEAVRPGTRYRAADILRLLDIATELLTTLLAHELHTLHALPPESHQQALLARIQSFIHHHLADPALSPQAVADAHHISLRRLQQVLATAGMTPATLIRRKRLERCRRALADPAQSARTIQTIAARWGFTNHAHFTRLFRTAYGMSPSEYRAAHSTLVREPARALHE
ncbi:helix-turn-helix domain-containing protein [Streptomyces aureoverticillatus]|uniref:helix-turn-helix domain-containing protein n=1 Tax=Streptomyces aureoverticillatus TaxID=66871 RepID=UPI0013D9D723|nr:helix-turn-helix domain-containing protein [Streptomyces aureoverticillatus]QIB42380.1 helix-turn-helix domain-containing protein [Streptomyces aureoverticillatus]